MIKHSVWPTSAPPVCTSYWVQEDWDNWEGGFRPVDYTGDRYDKHAWQEYLIEKENEYIAEYYNSEREIRRKGKVINMAKYLCEHCKLVGREENTDLYYCLANKAIYAISDNGSEDCLPIDCINRGYGKDNPLLAKGLELAKSKKLV